MALWSTKRRFIYGGSVILVLVLVFGGIFWKIIYKAPTCSDGRQNGDEKGVDCGGSCQLLCTSDTLAPVVLWSKVFHISGDVYTAVAYIQNPNINSKNPNATYQFTIYDTHNNLITVKDGQTSIPRGQEFAVFETGLVIKSSTPKSADFKFLTFAPWQKDMQKVSGISVNYSSLISATTSPRITGTISNTSLLSISSLELDAFVLDSKENIVAASRSFVDNLVSGTSQDFVFTWPKPFNLGVEACQSPVDVALALDRSGSMKSESVNPPEPFNTVKSTAENFIKNFTDSDQASIISFGDDGRLESNLSLNKQTTISAIDNLILSTSTSENTNVISALDKSFNELLSERGKVDSKKVIVLLTDGIPNKPQDSDLPSYPITGAQVEAKNIISNGVLIYTIGLGKNINEGFLKSISTDDSHYFFAPTKETLAGIYSKIGTNLCPRKPNVITVIYRSL